MSKKGKEQEDVNHPSYYAGEIEAIEVLRYFSFDIGSALKYLARAGKKEISSEKKDLSKSLFYMNDYVNSDVIEAYDIDLDKFNLFTKGKKYKDIIDRVLLFKSTDKKDVCEIIISDLEEAIEKL